MPVPKLQQRYKVSFSDPHKGPALDLRQSLTAESPLKITKNVFYFMLKALFILFGHVRIEFDSKAKVNFKIYDITD